MLSVYLLIAAIVVLPVILRLWAGEESDNTVAHHQDGAHQDDEDEPEGMLAAA